MNIFRRTFARTGRRSNSPPPDKNPDVPAKVTIQSCTERLQCPSAADSNAASEDRDAVRITFRVRVPNPSNTVYIAGTFNEWNPAGLAMTRVDSPPGRCAMAILAAQRGQQIQYKYTRGTWGSVEKGPTGQELPNRRLTVPQDGDAAITVEDTVEMWGDDPMVLAGNLGQALAKQMGRAGLLHGSGEEILERIAMVSRLYLDEFGSPDLEPRSVGTDIFEDELMERAVRRFLRGDKPKWVKGL